MNVTRRVVWHLPYRKQAKQIEKEVTAAGCTVEDIKTDEIIRNAEQLHALYLQTHKNARLRLVTLPVTFLPALADRLGDDHEEAPQRNPFK